MTWVNIEISWIFHIEYFMCVLFLQEFQDRKSTPNSHEAHCFWKCGPVWPFIKKLLAIQIFAMNSQNVMQSKPELYKMKQSLTNCHNNLKYGIYDRNSKWFFIKFSFCGFTFIITFHWISIIYVDFTDSTNKIRCSFNEIRIITLKCIDKSFVQKFIYIINWNPWTLMLMYINETTVYIHICL